MSVPVLLANARMYTVSPAAETDWVRLVRRVGELADVPLAYRPHPEPAPLEELWARDDFGLCFLCGWPFANLYPDHQAVAAPVAASNRDDGPPRYRTDLVVRAQDGPADLAAALAGRLGWTVVHSQSGYHAVNEFLAGREPAPERVGPLYTPRRVIEALEAGRIDVGPLDSLWHAILRRYEPAAAGRLRVVASTAWRPAPLLAASPGVPAATVGRLRAGLDAAARDPEGAAALAALGIARFRLVERSDYATLVASSGA